MSLTTGLILPTRSNNGSIFTDTDSDSDDEDDRWELTGEANSAEMLRGVPRSSLSLSAEAGKWRIGVKTHLCAGQMVRCLPAPGGRDGLWLPPPVIHRLPRRVAQFHPRRTSLPPARRVESAILQVRPLLGFLPSPPRATAFLCRLCCRADSPHWYPYHKATWHNLAALSAPHRFSVLRLSS